MSDPGPPWTGTVTIRSRDPGFAPALERALRPEASREVPRARAEVRLAAPTEVELGITASDTGAMRAALNTYLGWIDLAAATARTVAPRPAGTAEPHAGTD
jgi:tRNA threonylcarbamoyladenosine modification (KEOPS) complex  Pcc1 subunit